MSDAKLPAEWAKATLKEILSISSGKNLNQSKMIEGSIPVFGGNGITGWHNEPNVTEETIVIGRVGYYCGSVYVTPQLAWITDNAFITKFSKSCISSHFLFRLLQCSNLRQNDSGSAQPVISGAKIYPIEINLPPLAEQKVIADKLDSLLAQVENTKIRLNRIPNILKTFRQSVLSAAVSGKLTEEWREKHDHSQKIFKTKILEARRQAWEEAELARLVASKKATTNNKWRNKYKHPDSVLPESCFAIPIRWEWSNLGELSWSVKDGPHYSPKYSESGIPFISGGNISPRGIDFSNCKYISLELHEELSKRCKPEIGDILYTKGGTTGIAYFNTEEKDFNVWVHVAVIKTTNIVNGKYLQNALNSKHCYDQSQNYTHGVGNQDLGLTRMIKITIPIPPLNEQTEIVRRVEELFAFADNIEQKTNAALERVNNLTQSILAKAFRGELTADWRAENPDLISGENSAEALLAKIKAERDKHALEKKAARSPRKTKTKA
jgi:type I restriction enzyme S subunit